MNDATSRTLFGVGVGPGDPELVTVKTVRILREADVILVPYTEATTCLLYTSPSPRDVEESRMPSSA